MGTLAENLTDPVIREREDVLNSVQTCLLGMG
jgi:hypothetical protein